MTETIGILSPFETYFWVLAGIIFSLILPLAVNILRKARVELEGSRKLSLGTRFINAWNRYGGNKYLVIFLAASFIAFILLLLFDLKFYTIRDATLAGFAWESLINKLF